MHWSYVFFALTHWLEASHYMMPVSHNTQWSVFSYQWHWLNPVGVSAHDILAWRHGYYLGCLYIDGLVQDCSNSSAAVLHKAIELCNNSYEKWQVFHLRFKLMCYYSYGMKSSLLFGCKAYAASVMRRTKLGKFIGGHVSYLNNHSEIQLIKQGFVVLNIDARVSSGL